VNPRVERTRPPYVQIADHYRGLIVSGEIAEGVKLPAVAAVADEWGVTTATAAKAYGQLQVERLVRTSPRGTFVEGASRASSPRDRALRMHSLGVPSAAGEISLVTAAAVVTAPAYVAELFAMEGDRPRVVRREWVTSENTLEGIAPVMLSVSWYPTAFADTVPGILSTDSATVDTLATAIESAVGPTAHFRDFVESRSSDAREAGHLGLPIGGPVLAGAFLHWTAGDPGELVEYGEYVLPPKRVISWEYDIPRS
jgi:GntR family transcriptional regulator